MRSNNFNFIFQLINQFVYVGDHHASFSLLGSSDLLDLYSRSDVKAKVLEVDRINPLLFGLQYALYVGKSWLVQTEVAGEHSWQLHLYLLKTEVDFSLHSSLRVVVRENDLRAESSGWDAHPSSQNLTCLHIIVIDRLLSKDAQVELLLLHDVLEHFGHSKWLELLVDWNISVDMNAPVSSHRQSGTNGIDRSRKINYTLLGLTSWVRCSWQRPLTPCLLLSSEWPPQ